MKPGETVMTLRLAGWLLRGSEGAPAVIFLHRYGGDRSLLFNLGMKVKRGYQLYGSLA